MQPQAQCDYPVEYGNENCSGFPNVSKRRRMACHVARGYTLSSGKIREDNCWQAGNAGNQTAAKPANT